MRCSSNPLSAIILHATLIILFLPALAASGPSEDNRWDYHLAPYAWLAGQKGDVATLSNLPPAEIDIDFWDDVLGNINGALFLVGEARKGRFGAFLDLAYVDIEDETATQGPLFSSVSSSTKSWIVSAAGYAGVPFDPAKVSLHLNGFLLYRDGAPVEFDARAVSDSVRSRRDTSNARSTPPSPTPAT